jgi:hypothetical protein
MTVPLFPVKSSQSGVLGPKIPSADKGHPVRRLSGINVDPRVRGYNASQWNASANGMTQRQSIQDIDSLFSQINPGVLQNLPVIDGPYTSPPRLDGSLNARMAW